MSKINWEASEAEIDLIRRIAKRAVVDYGKAGVKLDFLDTFMDVSATHCNGCPLRLEEFLAADDFNFAHDITGIARHINRNTGKLEKCFLPRFSAGKKTKTRKRKE